MGVENVDLRESVWVRNVEISRADGFRCFEIEVRDRIEVVAECAGVGAVERVGVVGMILGGKDSAGNFAS